jgi:hypothetical protein
VKSDLAQREPSWAKSVKHGDLDGVRNRKLELQRMELLQLGCVGPWLFCFVVGRQVKVEV